MPKMAVTKLKKLFNQNYVLNPQEKVLSITSKIGEDPSSKSKLLEKQTLTAKITQNRFKYVIAKMPMTVISTKLFRSRPNPGT